MRTLVLGSASPARLGLLRAAGIEPVVRVSGVDEDAVVAAHVAAHVEAEGASPREAEGGEPIPSEPIPSELAALLARAKARDVARSVSGSDPDLATAIVVGCDSVLEWGGRSWGKPGTAANAVRRSREMRGTAGVLHTGHCVIDLATGAEHEAVASTEVAFGDITDEEIAAYVATGEPLNVAGGFTLDGLSAPFIDEIRGDPSNVIGLSLPLLRRMLRDLGISWPELWNRPPR